MVDRFRLALFLVVVALCLVLGGWIAGAGASAAYRGYPDPGPAYQDRMVVAAPGDTLWDIAIAHAPAGMDPRLAVYQLREHNSLAGAGIAIGQRICIPAHWPQ